MFVVCLDIEVDFFLLWFGGDVFLLEVFNGVMLNVVVEVVMKFDV